MNLTTTFVSIFFLFSLTALGQSLLRGKYPHGLLTDDFGILSEEDLLHDMKIGDATPYDIKSSVSRYPRWQCFPIKEVMFKYDKWKANDPLGSSHIIVTMCYFGIEARTGELTHIYIDRRARRLEFCQAKEKEWERLIQGQTHICLNGEADHLEGKKKNWTWVKAKTKNGCISLFEGDCNTKNILKRSE